GDVLEGVVRRGGRILVPPVAADEAVVGVTDPRVGREAVHDRPDRVGAGRRGAVALTVMGRHASPAPPAGPRAGPGHPAAAGTPPAAGRAGGRAHAPATMASSSPRAAAVPRITLTTLS